MRRTYCRKLKPHTVLFSKIKRKKKDVGATIGLPSLIRTQVKTNHQTHDDWDGPHYFVLEHCDEAIHLCDQFNLCQISLQRIQTVNAETRGAWMRGWVETRTTIPTSTDRRMNFLEGEGSSCVDLQQWAPLLILTRALCRKQPHWASQSVIRDTQEEWKRDKPTLRLTKQTFSSHLESKGKVSGEEAGWPSKSVSWRGSAKKKKRKASSTICCEKDRV